MSGYVTISNDALAVSRHQEGFDVAVFRLYVHADALRWRAFPCADSWMAEKLCLPKRQCRTLLDMLVDAGCVEIVSPGDDNEPRHVRVVKPGAEVDREPYRAPVVPRTAPQPENDSDLDRSSDREPDRDQGSSRTEEEHTQLPASPSTPNLSDVWSALMALYVGSGHSERLLEFDKTRQAALRKSLAALHKDPAVAAPRLIHLLAYWLYRPGPFWREKRKGSQLIATLLRHTEVHARWTESESWEWDGEVHKGSDDGDVSNPDTWRNVEW